MRFSDANPSHEPWKAIEVEALEATVVASERAYFAKVEAEALEAIAFCRKVCGD